MSFFSNATSFYVTAANTNANVNTNNTHTDPPAPLLKRVGTLWSFFRVIGSSFSFSPVGDDDDNKKEGKVKVNSEKVKRRSANPLASSSRMRMEACLLPQTQTRYHPVDLGVAITNPRLLPHHRRPLVGSGLRARTDTPASSLGLLRWGPLRR